MFSCEFREISKNTCNFIKKEALVLVVSCEFREIPKNTFFTEHLWTTASISLNFDLISQKFSLSHPKYNQGVFLITFNYLSIITFDLTKLSRLSPRRFCATWLNAESSKLFDLRLLLSNAYDIGQLSNLWLLLWFSKERLILNRPKKSESFLTGLSFVLYILKLIFCVSLFITLRFSSFPSRINSASPLALIRPKNYTLELYHHN